MSDAGPDELRNLSSDVAALLALDNSAHVVQELLDHPAILDNPVMVYRVLTHLKVLMEIGLPAPGSQGDMALKVVKRTARATDYRYVREQFGRTFGTGTGTDNA